jgi:FkbM family methyltransferase
VALACVFPLSPLTAMPSQLGQDRLVLELLGGKRGGFFLDSGAADGVRVSNTQLLETHYGWNGICVEPNRAFFAALVRNRRCRCLNCCLYDRDGEVEFLEAGTLGGILGEYHPSHLQFVKDRGQVPLNDKGAPVTVTRTARSVHSVLRECEAPRVIDYWSLDTEGSELAILKSFPYDEYSFSVLTVEHNRHSVREEIRAFLHARGYQRLIEMRIDDCYVSRKYRSVPPWRSGAWVRSK